MIATKCITIPLQAVKDPVTNYVTVTEPIKFCHSEKEAIDISEKTGCTYFRVPDVLYDIESGRAEESDSFAQIDRENQTITLYAF